MIPQKDDVTFIIPTLNEENGVGRVIEEIKRAGFQKIVVVDGRSEDKTVENARRKGVRVIFQGQKGKTEAVRTGIESAETEFVALVDGDGSYDPADVEKMLELAAFSDQVIGRRRFENIKILRRLGNKVVTSLVESFTQSDLGDVCSGLYLLRTRKAKELLLDGNGFSTEVEIVFRMSRVGAISHVPINYRERIGNSKLSLWKHGPQILLSIFRIALEKPRNEIPNGRPAAAGQSDDPRGPRQT